MKTNVLLVKSQLAYLSPLACLELFIFYLVSFQT